jgi:hypothetical protein
MIMDSETGALTLIVDGYAKDRADSKSPCAE